jgi:hypothetical protein
LEVILLIVLGNSDSALIQPGDSLWNESGLEISSRLFYSCSEGFGHSFIEVSAISSNVIKSYYTRIIKIIF